MNSNVLEITSIINWICRTFYLIAKPNIPFQPQLSAELKHNVESKIKHKIKAKVATTVKTNSNVLQILSDNCRSQSKVVSILKFKSRELLKSNLDVAINGKVTYL